MNMDTKMTPFDIIGKKISVKGINGKLLFYTVVSVKEITADYILFVDKFNNTKQILRKNIEEIVND